MKWRYLKKYSIMKTLKNRHIVVITVAVALVGILYSLIYQSGEFENNVTQNSDGWDALINTAQKQKAAGDFAMAFKTQSLGNEALVRKEELQQKADGRIEEERAMLREIEKSLRKYPKFFSATLRMLSNKAFYESLLYTSPAHAKKEVGIRVEALKRNLEEVRQLRKELTLYQVSEDKELSEIYKETINKLKSYDIFGDQLQNFISEILKQTKNPEECLRFVTTHHPDLLESYKTLR